MPHLERIRDVGEDRHVRPDRVGLEHHADLPALRCHEESPGGIADDAVTDGDAAGVVLLETGDHPERRRLAAPRGPEQGEEPTVGDRERDAVDGPHGPEALADVVDDDRRHYL
jgi:hypothetical protein